MLDFVNCDKISDMNNVNEEQSILVHDFRGFWVHGLSSIDF